MKKLNIFLYLNCAFYIGVCSNVNFSNDFETGSDEMTSVRPIYNFIADHQKGRIYNNSQFRDVIPICAPEEFVHFYIKNDKELERVKNFWNSAKINETATLHHMCLQRNGLPVTRKCLFDYWSGAKWERIDNSTVVKCLKSPREKIITTELSELHEKLLESNSNLDFAKKREEIIRKVRIILEKPKSTFVPADVFYTNKVLEDVFEASPDVEISQDIVSICNTVMSVEKHVLRKSAEVNSTNKFLKNFENYMDSLPARFVPPSRCGSSVPSRISSVFNESEGVHKIDSSNKGVHAHLSTKVSVFYINPRCANITGIAIYDKLILSSPLSSPKIPYERHGSFVYRFVYANERATDLMKESYIEVAAFLPEKLWKYLQTHLPEDSRFIVLKVFADDSLFVETGKMQSCRPTSRIISISIPTYSGRFPDPIPFLVRNQKFDPKSYKTYPSGTGCGFWNYQTWLKDDVKTESLNDLSGPVVLCSTKHLTQFSFLLGGQYRQEDPNDDFIINPVHKRVLNIISLVGCLLSLLGLIGIWITAILFKSWRSLSSTKVLLNLCLALTLQMILFLFVNTKDMSENLVKEKSYFECIALGAVLQYFILVLFMWMLIVAFLQFQRYVTVLGIQRPSHYILKAAIIAWSLPLVPTLIVAFVDPEGFIPSNFQMETNNAICYPSGYGLAFGIIFPITVICIANLIIFIYVFYSISHTLNQAMNKQETLMIVKQIRLSVLLFFLLGLCWIFGIFSFLNDSVVFSYLFCLTATLQGFVLFMYFVVFSDVPRKAWYELLCSKKQDKSKSKVHEMQSMTTSSVAVSASDRK